jgi:hypothetical protein
VSLLQQMVDSGHILAADAVVAEFEHRMRWTMLGGALEGYVAAEAGQVGQDQV